MLYGWIPRLGIIMGDCEGVMPDGVEYDNASTVNRELVGLLGSGVCSFRPTLTSS